jgi:hypothetical protein
MPKHKMKSSEKKIGKEANSQSFVLNRNCPMFNEPVDGEYDHESEDEESS